MSRRTNVQWLEDLAGPQPVQDQALQALRDQVLRVLQTFLAKQAATRGIPNYDDVQPLAEDCTQETLLAVRRNLTGFRGDSQFTTWVFAIALRITQGELRRRRWRANALNQGLSAVERLPVWPMDSASGPGPEHSLQQQQTWQLVGRLIDLELTPRQRTALVAHALNDVPLDQVAELLHTNRDAVYKLIHDARKKLKRALLERGIRLTDLLKIFEVG